MGEQVSDTRATPNRIRALGLPFVLRMAALAGAVIALAGCAGTMESRTPAPGFPDVLNAEEMASESTYDAAKERPEPAIGTGSLVTALSPCAIASARYRVRDLSVPWAQRRYLKANGTVCSPNEVGSL